MVISEIAVPVRSATLQIENISKGFQTPQGTTIDALKNFSLTIDDGQLTSLIGPSGCGKSTLLRLLAGLERPSAGSIRIGNQAITGPGSERGLIFQDPNLFPWLTVRGNIKLGLSAQGLARTYAHRIDEYINLIGMNFYQQMYPHQLSGGMAQRVALARALVNHPRVLLLDEPLGALDQFTRMSMQDEVLRIWTLQKITMVLVTHDIDEAIYMSNSIAVMTSQPGRIESIIPVTLDYPRQRNSPEFLQLRSRILEALHFAGNTH